MAEQPTESQVIEALVASAAAGDRAAQQQLLRQYWPVIRQLVRACRARAGAPFRALEETEDIEQEVAMSVLSALPKQEWQGRAAFRAWLRKLAAARVVDAQRYHLAGRRDRRREAALEPGDVAAVARNPESQVQQARRLAVLSRLLDRIDPQYAGAVILHHLGYSHAEIGELLECTAEAARKLVSRGEAKLVRLTENDT